MLPVDLSGKRLKPKATVQIEHAKCWTGDWKQSSQFMCQRIRGRGERDGVLEESCCVRGAAALHRALPCVGPSWALRFCAGPVNLSGVRMWTECAPYSSHGACIPCVGPVPLYGAYMGPVPPYGACVGL